MLRYYTAIFAILVGNCYGPNVISITVTKGGHLKGNRLYRTSGTMGRGVAELRKSSVYKNMGMWEYI